MFYLEKKKKKIEEKKKLIGYKSDILNEPLNELNNNFLDELVRSSF